MYIEQIQLNAVINYPNITDAEKVTVIGLLRRRFPKNKDPSYISEWCERVVGRCAWSRGDTPTRNALTESGYFCLKNSEVIL